MPETKLRRRPGTPVPRLNFLKRFLPSKPHNPQARYVASNAHLANGSAQEESQDLPEAIGSFQKSVELAPLPFQDAARVSLLRAQIANGELEQSLATVEQLNSSKLRRAKKIFELAKCLCGLSQLDAEASPQHFVSAIGLLTRCAEMKGFEDAERLSQLESDSRLDPLREDSRFKMILAGALSQPN